MVTWFFFLSGRLHSSPATQGIGIRRFTARGNIIPYLVWSFLGSIIIACPTCDSDCWPPPVTTALRRLHRIVCSSSNINQAEGLKCKGLDRPTRSSSATPRGFTSDDNGALKGPVDRSLLHLRPRSFLREPDAVTPRVLVAANLSAANVDAQPTDRPPAEMDPTTAFGFEERARKLEAEMKRLAEETAELKSGRPPKEPKSERLVELQKENAKLKYQLQHLQRVRSPPGRAPERGGWLEVTDLTQVPQRPCRSLTVLVAHSPCPGVSRLMPCHRTRKVAQPLLCRRYPRLSPSPVTRTKALSSSRLSPPSFQTRLLAP